MGEHGAQRVRLVGALVRPVAQHAGEAQGDAAGVARGALDAVEGDLDHELGPDAHDPAVVGLRQRQQVLRLPAQPLVRPELVVEIALDGVQASTRYPGGVALRFARVKRYRPDKDAVEADTIDALRALLPARR